MPVVDEASALRMTVQTPLLILTRTHPHRDRALTVEEIHTPTKPSPAIPSPVTTVRAKTRRNPRPGP